MRTDRLVSVVFGILAAVPAAANAQGTPPSGSTPPPGTNETSPATAPAGGQKGGGGELPAASADKVLKLAYGYRRDGLYDAASAAFFGVLPSLKGKDRERVVHDMGQMYLFQGKWEKAVRFYRQENDQKGELAAIVLAGRVDDALGLVKKLGDPVLEGQVLEDLDRKDEALEAYKRAEAHGHAGKLLLLKMNKPKDAAAEFALAKQPYLRAVALDLAGESAAAAAAFAEAKPEEEKRTEEDAKAADAAKAAYDNAPDPLERERGRYELAKAVGALVEDYDRLSVIAESGKKTTDAAKAAELAAKAARLERDLLTDRGGDKYGEGLAKKRDLAGRLARLEERAAALLKAAGGG